jgi:hypothetical protein
LLKVALGRFRFFTGKQRVQPNTLRVNQHILRPWIGFLHHLFNEAGQSLLHTPEFRTSLPACRGIVVFSRYLQRRLEQELLALAGRPPPPVFFLPRPMDAAALHWSPQRFLANPERLHTAAHCCTLLHTASFNRHLKTHPCCCR